MESPEKEAIEKAVLLRDMAGVHGKTLSDGSVGMMIRALWDIPAKDLEIAIDVCLRQKNKMPAVSELIDAAEKHGDPYANCRTVVKFPPGVAEALYAKYYTEDDDGVAYTEAVKAEMKKQREANAG